MNTGYIYELVFEDDERYIGITKVGLKTRLYTHKKKFKTKIKESFVIDIVRLEELYYFEKFYISLYKSFGFKLKNLNNGGGGKNSYSITGEKKLNPIDSFQHHPNLKRRKIIKYDNFLNKIKEYESISIAAFEENVVLCVITKNLLLERLRDKKCIWIYKEKENQVNIIKNKYLYKTHCPFCLNDNIIKNGKYIDNNHFRYKCKECLKNFNDFTYFPFLLKKLLITTN